MLRPLEKYQFYLNTFHVQDNEVWQDMERRLSSPQVRKLELSHKIEHGQLYSKRMHIWYSVFAREELQGILHFIGKQVNVDSLLHTVDTLCSGNVLFMAYGVDLRPDPEHSRFKLWFGISEDQRTVERLLKKHARYKTIMAGFSSHSVLAGVEVFGSGLVRSRLYSFIPLNDQNSPQNLDTLGALVPEPVMTIIRQCKAVYISYSPRSRERIFHFEPGQDRSFLKQMRLPRYESLNEHYQAIHMPLTVFSLKESEIIRQRVTTVNLYY